jgi:uncharacterized coiled-coil protein SlyX
MPHVTDATEKATATAEGRLVDLELRFMKLERFAHDLSDVVTAQQRRIDALLVEVKRLRDRALEEEPAVPNDRPPHY